MSISSAMNSTREQVLNMLLAAGDAVSGSELARRLGISRSAVWKAIGQLREEGYAIDAATNRGYRIVGSGDVLSAYEIARQMQPGEIGSEIEMHDEIDSTNNRAKELAAKGAAHGTVVMAREQSMGRGRFGRRFHSPEGSGVYFSCILRPRIPADRAVMVTSMAAVAVARAIERVAEVKASIKWVNDVYIGRRKVCGILCEAGLDFESGQMQYVVMGIGVNVGKMEFPEELQEIATSISNECGKRVTRSSFAAALIDELNALYPKLEEASFMEEYRSRSNVIGREVEVLRGSERYGAKAVGISDEGSLIVETAGGAQQVLHSGEISLKLR